MKKSNLLMGLILLLQIATASADAAVVDVWKLASGEVKPAKISKADGTFWMADPSQEVLLLLGLQSTTYSGSRENRIVKSKEVIPATSTQRAVIKVEIESDAETQCHYYSNPQNPFWGPTGRPTADVRVVVKPGEYILVVNNFIYGVLVVGSDNVQVAPLPTYNQEASGYAAQEAAKVFGELDGKKVVGENCSFELKKVGHDLFVEYSFPSYQETQRNGDILIRKEVKGFSKITGDMTLSSCSNKKVSWERTLSGENRVEIRIERGHISDFRFSVEDSLGDPKYCR